MYIYIPRDGIAETNIILLFWLSYLVACLLRIGIPPESGSRLNKGLPVFRPLPLPRP